MRKLRSANQITVVLGTRWRLGTFLSCVSVLLIVCGIVLMKSFARRDFSDGIAEVCLAAGVSLFSMVALLLFERAFDEIRAGDVAIERSLNHVAFLNRLRHARRDIRIFTTWTVLFCRESEFEDGLFEKLLDVVHELRESGRAVDVELVLIDPRQRSIHQRADELPEFFRRVVENYDCMKELVRVTANSAVEVTPRFFRGLPPFSYYQVDRYVNIGFFPYGEDSSHGRRLAYLIGASAGGTQMKSIFKWLISRPPASLDFNDPEIVEHLGAVRAQHNQQKAQ